MMGSILSSRWNRWLSLWTGAVVGLVLTVGLGRAADIAWSGGGGSSDWGNSSNWSVTGGSDGDGIPDGDDDVTFPETGVYASGVDLNGADRAANSLTYATTAGFTISGSNTLTLTSGQITRQNISGTEGKHTIGCDLNLAPTTGTNAWSISGSRANSQPSLQVDGTITRSVPLDVSSSNTNVSVGFYTTGAQGTGDIELGTNGGAMFGGVSQTVGNAINVTGTIADITSYVPTTLAGGLDVPSGTTLTLGARNYGQDLVVLSAPTTGAGALQIFRGDVAIDNVNQLPGGNLDIGTSGGDLILDGVSWADFSANYPDGFGSGADQWRLAGGIGARGQNLLIQASGTDAGGTNTTTYFDRNFAVGANYSTSGATYADAKVTVDVDTELTTRRTWNVQGNLGPGLTGTHDNGRVHEFAGDITDQVAAGTGTSRGAIRVDGTRVNDEIIFSGSNNWTGSHAQGGHHGEAGSSMFLNSGPGGLQTYCNSGAQIMVQFPDQDSIPTGNGGNPAWLAGTSRYGGSAGFILGAQSGGETYQLPSGMEFLLGTSPDGVLGVTGAAGTSALLRDTSVNIHSAFSSTIEQPSKTLDLLVRGATEFALGTPGAGHTGAVLMIPSKGLDTIDTGIDGAATAIGDATTSRVLRKRGDGTLILGHVDYTDRAGSADTSGQFGWELGAGNGLSFDGAVRETGTDVSTSTAGFPVAMRGGVIELGAADLARNTGTGTGEIDMLSGGGFSAYGADRQATLNGGADLTWGDTGIRFTHTNYPLTFGSQTATHTLELTNALSLNSSGTRVIYVVDGTGTAPEADLSGILSGAATLRLAAPVLGDGSTIAAGTLELSNASNTFTGPVSVEAGTLLVTGVTGIHAVNSVTVSAGAALGGTGDVRRPVTISTAATIAPGTSVGTLTVADLTMADSSVYEWEVGPGAADLVAITDALSFGGDMTLRITFVDGRTDISYDEAFVLFDYTGADPTLGTVNIVYTNAARERGGLVIVDAANDQVTISGFIPEPATFALVVLGMGSLVARRGCRRSCQ